jgi:hypothetical protein
MDRRRWSIVVFAFVMSFGLTASLIPVLAPYFQSIHLDTHEQATTTHPPPQ